MHSLDQILQENTALSDDEARVRHATLCSPYIQRLLNSDAALLEELLEQLHGRYTEADMRAWLAAQTITDEASLKAELRRLRQRVMLRVIVRDLSGLGDLDEV